MEAFTSIGTIHTPYNDEAPFRPDPDAKGPFYISIFPEYVEALEALDSFSHIMIFFQFDRSLKKNLKAHPPSHPGKEVGLFASRSPNRINKIGLDTVQLIRIEENRIFTSPMDILDGTLLLDIKPYIKDLDCFPEANNGWLK